MCLYLRVFWTVLHNLVVRMVSETVDVYYNGCCKANSERSETSTNANGEIYVIMNEPEDTIPTVPAITLRPMESESYFRAVDRLNAEEILTNRVDGSCLVRPYKEQNPYIKYVVSIYAKGNYFHLFIRKITGTDKYAIGLEKPFEKQFNTPNDIINYYRLNKLLCTNKNVSLSLVLVPIS